MIWSSSGYWVNMEGWLLENLCLCPVLKKKGLGFTGRHQSVREVRSAWLKQSRKKRIGWQVQQTLNHTITSALQKMQQAAGVASATWRHWLGKSAWAHVRVPAEMLARSFAGMDRDQFLRLHLFATVWIGRFHCFNWMPTSAPCLLCTYSCALGQSSFRPSNLLACLLISLSVRAIS